MEKRAYVRQVLLPIFVGLCFGVGLAGLLVRNGTTLAKPDGATSAAPTAFPENPSVAATKPEEAVQMPPDASPSMPDALTRPPSAADIVRMYNDAVRLAREAGGFWKKTVKTKFTVAGDAGVEKLLHFKIPGLDMQKILTQLTGDGLLTAKTGSAQDLLEPVSLTEADILTAHSYKDTQGDVILTLFLRGGTDQGNGVIPRFSADFYDVAYIRRFMENPGVPGLKVTAEELTAHYDSIEITAALGAQGELRRAAYSWGFSAGAKNGIVRLAGVKLGGGAWANAFGHTSVTATPQ